MEISLIVLWFVAGGITGYFAVRPEVKKEGLRVEHIGVILAMSLVGYITAFLGIIGAVVTWFEENADRVLIAPKKKEVIKPSEKRYMEGQWR